MSVREDILAILRYQDYKQFPLVYFGFWQETIEKWHREGHLPVDCLEYHDGSESDEHIRQKLGFDYNWGVHYSGNMGLLPSIEPGIIEELPNGQIKSLDGNGAIVLTKPGVVSIPTEVGHLLQDRASWEEHFLPRLQMSSARIDQETLEILKNADGRSLPVGMFCGSLFGVIRNWLGLENSAYLLVDDEELFDEIINTNAGLQFAVIKQYLEQGARPDYAHFWEDICCKSGPLIQPEVFAGKIGPWYRRFSELLAQYGVDLISLDCDGKIDELLPVWLKNGINVMFPIEVGVWEASIEPWRQKYGKSLRGVGGMNKNVFAADYEAVDREIERLRPLIELGGYIPCPDHRIPADARWENVQYYCEKMRSILAR